MFKRKPSEIRWLRACLKGNEKAFEHIVQHYQPLVCAITYSRTGNRADSEELAQEVFIKAWRNLHQLEDLAKFHSWLCRIAQTTVQNWYRSRKRDVVAGAEPLENVEATAGIESNPEEKTIRQEHEALVSQALSQLPIELREALVLYYRGQHSTRQVAQQLDISEGATRTRISRGRQILRGRLHSIVEETLTLTRPGQTFTRVVMASVTALSIDNATAVASSHLSGHGLSIGGLSLGTAGKLSLIIVAGLTIVVGSLAVHRHRANTAIEHLSPQSQIAASKTDNVSEDGLDLPSIERQPTTAPVIGQPASSESESPSLSPNTESPSAPLEPYVFKPKGVLSGLVTDIETGEAIVNAWVRLSTYPSIETQTDIHGFYSFSFADANGVTSCKIAVEATTHVDPERRGLNYSNIQLTQDIQVVKHFKLARGCSLDVQVVDSNGIGIPNARVLASAPYDLLNQFTGFWGTSKRGTLVQTDPNGMINLGPYPVADTDYLIQAWDESRLKVDKESMAPEELRS
ncbi:MAG: sigma-70 family RNA polymerase sigma factor, partial [Planctomycetes bacterium]|nr:sigma-70 family RNA polymerase sigma factor [Planctomycetota bacterium]